MNCTINPSSILAFDQSMGQLGHDLKKLSIAICDVRQTILDNGKVFMPKHKQSEIRKAHNCEFKIEDNFYLVSFEAVPYVYNGHSDFEVEILQIEKCGPDETDMEVIYELHCNEFDQIKGKVYDHWEEAMPFDFYEEEDGCPVNDDTKDY